MADRLIWVVENGEPVLYKRQGECKGCGKCCCESTITFQMETQLAGAEEEEPGTKSDDWEAWEGWSVFQSQGIWWWFKITKIVKEKSDCSALQDGAICTYWQDPEEWPVLCRYWPVHPSNLEKFLDCGFSFTKETAQ